jgi:hypothetical protein
MWGVKDVVITAIPNEPNSEGVEKHHFFKKESGYVMVRLRRTITYPVLLYQKNTF